MLKKYRVHKIFMAHLRPPNSDDLNPVDNCAAYNTRCIADPLVTSNQSPQGCLIEEWQKFNQKIIDWAIKHWPPCPRSCLKEGEGHFEQQL